MRAKVFGSIETLSPEISVPMRLVPLGEGDFSTLWRLCMESPSQLQLACVEQWWSIISMLIPRTPFAASRRSPQGDTRNLEQLSYWRLTGFGRNDNEAGWVFVSICSLQTYDKASAAKLSNYPVRNQSFFHSPFWIYIKNKLTISQPVCPIIYNL